MKTYTWCLVGNIKKGTKHFPSNAKVYCLPAQWGDGYEKIIVIGRRRKSKRFITIIIQSNLITNWRTKIVYNPKVLKRLKSPITDYENWESKEHVEYYVDFLSKRENELKGK